MRNGRAVHGTSVSARLPCPGSDHRIYYDDSTGWEWLQRGVASYTQDPATIGLFRSGNWGIKVFGTDGRWWCITAHLPASWTDWRVC
jgi:hypothetical protein